MNRLNAKTSILNLLLILLLALTSFSASASERVTYYHNDHLGSPVAATNAQGELLWQEEYSPYGKRLVKADTSDNPRGYTGHQEVAALGLTHMDARWYDPELGRFLAIDPVDFHESNIQSFNRYAYANNNPYRYIDPDGESPFDIAFLAVDVVKLGVAIYSGKGVAAAAADVGMSIVGVISPVPGTGLALKSAKTAKVVKNLDNAGDGASVARGAGKTASQSGDIIHVTKSGVALPPGPKHHIPDNYVQNPHRSGSYGEVVEGKFKERLRIDPPTPAGQKGPNYSHYHKDGKGTHFSPRAGDKDPGF